MQKEIIYIDCEPSQNISQKESVGYERSNEMLFDIQESLNNNIKIYRFHFIHYILVFIIHKIYIYS